MNGWVSECSSGCESGWTMYLDHSSSSANPCTVGTGFDHPLGSYGKDAKEDASEAEEEDDLSMVSDASSGPPHFHEDEDCYYYYDENAYFCSAVSSAATLAKKNGQRRRVQDHHEQHPSSSFLDDTASSPLVSLSKNKLTTLTKSQASGENVFSQGFSGNHFKGKSSFPKHFSFFESALPEKSTAKNSNAVVSSFRP
ncbi:hypothetical protein NE237_023305 [Protea cynaroides]|uniref:Uncharacterized protein n=1 Tax=Protea cynaroides TaxID=273540 RepID=A0A9Q0HB75_9MAGN|nr:hypothetical protein NE237_023305 [Protea cynaroides]